MRVVRAFLRVVALLLLLALLAGVPVLVFRLVGLPLPGSGELSSAWRDGRIDAGLVLRVGAGVFAILWLWFAVTALAELWHVLAWRFGGPSARLAPLPSGPSGWVRGLVRFVAVSSMSASAALGSIVPLAGASSPSAPSTAARPAAMSSVTAPPSSRPAATHLATGRDTPYSVAAAHGRAELRERIIQLNVGRVGPDGMAWQGGVFPAGMDVVLPDELLVATALGAAHEVVAGDSYWRIADEHLTAEMERDASAHEILDYTHELITFNRDLLGHRDPTLIVPGELVVFVDVPRVEASVPGTGDVGGVPPAVAPEVVAPEVLVPAVAAPELVAPEVAVPEVVVHWPAATPAAATPLPVEAAAPAESPLPVEGPTQGRPAVAPTARAGDHSSAVVPFAAGLGTALMMSAGALGLLETRRRRQLRAATVGARLAPHSADEQSTEVLLRSLHASERMARLDLAIRSAARSLAAQHAAVLAAVLYDTGDVCLFLRGHATPEQLEWRLDPHANTWRLSGSTSLATLASAARRCAQPCPAMVHVGGVAEGGELFVDVEAVGTLVVRSPHAEPILRAIAAALAVSPFIEGTRLFTVGLGAASLNAANSEPIESLDAALDAAAMALGSTGVLARDASTFALRVAGAGGEAWEPAVVVASVGPAGGDAVAGLGAELRTAAAGGRGLAVVVDAPFDEPVHAAGGWEIRCAAGSHVLEPLGLTVLPVGVSEADIASVAGLLVSADSPLVQPADAPLTHDVVALFAGDGAAAEPFREPDWALLVRVLGQVQVTARSGVAADCERSKATELIVWLSQHRERPTRNAARTALWDLDVRDATFANVVSDARRAMARAAAPAEGEEWIARTLTEELPLHPRVVTDAELLAARVEHARNLSALDAIEVLRPGLELVGGMPFAGTSYLWTDAEGITSSLVLLATGAAIELANHYLSLGDVDGVFWATGQGLRVLSGHEELIALRMRAHARRGDLAGVRGEWESYERAIAADPWAAAEPAPKLVALRRELLSPGRETAVASLRAAG